MKPNKNNWWTKWQIWCSLPFVILFGYKNISEYLMTRNSQYGRLANEKRKLMSIPIIADYLKPIGAPKSKYEGLRWQTSKNPTPKEPLIHRSKTVDANKVDGWLQESDALRFYINDTTCFQLNLISKIFQDSVVFTGQLGKVDTRNEWVDIKNKYPNYEWQKMESFQIDSIRKTWGK